MYSQVKLKALVPVRSQKSSSKSFQCLSGLLLRNIRYCNQPEEYQAKLSK